MAYGHHIPIKQLSAVPKIGGSQAGRAILSHPPLRTWTHHLFHLGFIALIVFLSVLIVVCCSAVFYLLRYHEPTDQDRTARRERYDRRHRAEVDGSTVETPFGEKLKQVWNRIRHGKRRGGRGWIQAGSGDDWVCSPDRGDQALSHEGQVRSLPKNDIEDIPRTVESSVSGTGDDFVSPHYYCDPFSNGSTTSRSMDILRAQSPLSESTSKEDESDEEQATRDPRHFSTLSTASGTRFIEHV